MISSSVLLGFTVSVFSRSSPTLFQRGLSQRSMHELSGNDCNEKRQKTA